MKKKKIVAKNCCKLVKAIGRCLQTAAAIKELKKSAVPLWARPSLGESLFGQIYWLQSYQLQTTRLYCNVFYENGIG